MENDGTQTEAIELYPMSSENIPDGSLTSGPYALEFARTPEELDAIFRLRFEVFNIELNEGLDASLSSGRDVDEFDPFCHHLYVRNTSSGQVVGTYRMQTHEMAATGNGLYSATEFDFAAVPEAILTESVEIGRACIAIDHRSLQVLYLLWRGLGLYLSHNKLRYLFGCCSLTSQNESDGLSVLRQLRARRAMLESWNVHPLPTHTCCPDETIVAGDTRVKIPRLMRAYLALGARICGPPAIDRSFKTIDFLALFDVDQLSKRAMSFYRVKR